MKVLRTAILVAIALILGLWAVYGERHIDEKRASEREDIRLGRFDENDIATFTIITSEDTIVAESTGDTTWRILKPIPWKGDSYRFEVVSRELRTSARQRKLVVPEDSLRYYTLQYPNARLIYTFKDESTPPETLDVGSAAPDEKTGYVRFAGSDTVIKTNVAVHQAIARRFFDFRDKHLFEDYHPGQVEDITIRKVGGTIEMSKTDGRWRMTSPIERWADADTLNRLLKVFETSLVKDYYDNPGREPSFFGLGEKSRAEVKLALRDDHGDSTREDRLRLGTAVPARQGRGYIGVWGEDVARPNTVMHLPIELLLEVDRNVENYWDHRTTMFERRVIDSVAVIRPDETIMLSMDSTATWHMWSPRQQQAYRPRVNRIVADMDRNRLVQFTGLHKDINDPQLEIRLFNGTDLQASLKFGVRLGAGVYARGSANDEIVILSGKVLDDLNASVDEFNVPAQPDQSAAE